MKTIIKRLLILILILVISLTTDISPIKTQATVHSVVTSNSYRSHGETLVGIDTVNDLYYRDIINALQKKTEILDKYKTDSDISSRTVISAMKTEEKIQLNIKVQNMLERARIRRRIIRRKEARKREIESYEISISPNRVNGSVNEHTVLTKRRTITAKEMDKIINHFLAGRNSLFKDKGKYFIKASNETNYDPIFLMALAATESGWHVSHLHRGKSNPYSINMTDQNPNGGYKLGNTYGEGIINGAIWIKDHYFNQGHKTLYGMNFDGKTYCSSPNTWIRQIVSIMNEAYGVL